MLSNNYSSFQKKVSWVFQKVFFQKVQNLFLFGLGLESVLDIFKDFVNTNDIESRSEEGKENALKFGLKVLENIFTEKIAQV
jgi:hypothetical protein